MFTSIDDSVTTAFTAAPEVKCIARSLDSTGIKQITNYCNGDTLFGLIPILKKTFCIYSGLTRKSGGIGISKLRSGLAPWPLM